MNWQIIQGKWHEMTGSVREKWGELTDDEIMQVEGKKERFEGLLKQKYGITQDAASKQIDEWAGQLKDTVNR